VHAGAAGVLLVDRLPGHAEDLGDLLPGPAVFPGVVDLERLELLQQPAEGGDGPEPGAAARAGAFSILSIYVDISLLSTWVDIRVGRADYEALTRAS
jgi:hypothetical protein